ncbi:MAG: hypothetical protein NC253_01690 [Ruminococcus sp.]|nr:hypothetical protein [Ruminococcus sp.]MCM1380747.1 hypothetical protein [Muribaculaceae bacterium]MCM1478707.1 hypothetical protein [Muribaculaceae bacterium]
MNEQYVCRVTFDTSEETRIKETIRMREKALHDEASALFNAEERGRAEVRTKFTEKMRSAGLSEEQIQAIINK